MRQLTLISPNRLEWQEVAPPALSGADAALVRPIAVGVCDFDRALVSGRYTSLSYPMALGHEIVAEVVETGPAVSKVRTGAQVILPLHISCGCCSPCLEGRTNSCDSRRPLSNYGLGSAAGNYGGGMSDLLNVPFADAMLVEVPEPLAAVDCAAVGCNLVDLYRAIAPYLEPSAEPEVLIVSGDAGNMALYGVAMARALGVEDVHFLDDDEVRLADAAALGAKPVKLGESLPKKGYPIVVDCSADKDRLGLALRAVGKDGVCTPVWPYAGSASIPIESMFMRNARLVTGQPHARAHMEPVLKLMQTRGLSSRSIPFELMPWDSADTQFGRGTRKRIFVR